MTAIRTPFNDLPRATQAGILCNDPRFQDFAARHAESPGRFCASAAAEWLRTQCRVASRRDLDLDDTAAARFDALRTDFDAHTGKIATPDR
jgi:hypothetical protein